MVNRSTRKQSLGILFGCALLLAGIGCFRLIAGCGKPEDTNPSAAKVGGSGLIAGWGKREASGGSVGTTVVGIDVSGSALARKEDLMRLARREIQKVREGSLEVHRFDRKAQELYSGEPLLDPERLTKHLRSWFEEAAGGLGTSLPAFLERVDQRLNTLEKPIRIVVISDCGMELTTPQERSAALARTKRWADQHQVAEVTVLGLAPGQREAIRACIDPRLLRIWDDL